MWKIVVLGAVPLALSDSTRTTSAPQHLEWDVTGAFKDVEKALPAIWNEIPETPFKDLKRLIDAVRNESERISPYFDKEDELKQWGRSVSGFSSDELAFIQCLGGSGNPHSFIDQATRTWSQSLTSTQGYSSPFSRKINAWRNKSYCVRAKPPVTPELRYIGPDLYRPQYLPLILTDGFLRGIAPLSTHLDDQYQECGGDYLDLDNGGQYYFESGLPACERSIMTLRDELNKTLNALPERIRFASSIAQGAVQAMFATGSQGACHERDDENTSIPKNRVVYIGQYTFPSFEKGEVRVTCAGSCDDASALQKECATLFNSTLNAVKVEAERVVQRALDEMALELIFIMDDLRREVEGLLEEVIRRQQEIESENQEDDSR